MATDFVAAFATIVGLLANFRQERQSQQELTHRDFIEWLQNHRHEQLVEIVTRTQGLQTQIDDLLQQNFSVLAAKIDTANDLLARILGRVEGFQGLSASLVPQSQFSSQALLLLRGLVESKDEAVCLMRAANGVASPCRIPSGEGAEYEDERFLEADLEFLADSGLLRRGFKGVDGETSFHLTRGAVQFVNALGARV